MVGALRTAAVGIALATCAGAAVPQAAQAAPATTTTTAAPEPISFAGTAADGDRSRAHGRRHRGDARSRGPR